jgi:hypothetical protein
LGGKWADRKDSKDWNDETKVGDDAVRDGEEVCPRRDRVEAVEMLM